MPDDLRDRVADLERRVAALEAPATPAAAPEGAGHITYSGRLERPAELAWDIALHPAAVLGLDDAPRVEVLAALAHPVRTAIVRELAENGSRPAADLQTAAGLGSTGQLYHHLKALTSAGIVEQDGRGSYRLRPVATVPTLVLLAAAADVAGQLRT
ncbi:ArsR/SmtB family transcription factor [Amycolatopsis suaedae]|uniref:ArsR family transcriptional regulator n=1 Tax=Amycolatopsis suaedae TaxID=2510978 RepID=A0A4Q7IWX3_9PSEU|nr:helix-turn-helix domain-containing protein [Amycolatopsis suaedae]RZQ59431.1 ArsR family transcriptional regulator [Amycolatopsis suaedae]